MAGMLITYSQKEGCCWPCGAGIAINETPVTGEAFPEALKVLDAKTAAAVHFRRDRAVESGRFLRIMDQARSVGVVKLHLI